ncbi:cyclomaltodextrinase [Artemisia annua]|uniref:Cyclomaltodextrinase n=1 Tax=Artemisia annua TaxID=35608 RepID=A0A2U1N9I7_ARTAN|nr:cyclomaltodextrinase [Artemisia annua]
MKNSSTPNDFPTKKQLLDAGRLDLVTAISNTGGWLAFGWDDDDQDHPPHPHFDDDAEQQQEDTGGGVDGILTRLHNHRIRTHQEYKAHHVAVQPTFDVSPCCFPDKSTPRGVSTTYFSDFQGYEDQLHYAQGSAVYSFPWSLLKIYYILHGFGIHLTRWCHSSKDLCPLRWQVTSAGDNDLKMMDLCSPVVVEPFRYLFRMSLLFAWISASMCVGACSGMHTGHMHRFQFCATLVTKIFSSNLNQVHDSSASELQQLSDVWEFQENELMKAEDKLRSIRSKLAVFEGKIALSVTYAFPLPVCLFVLYNTRCSQYLVFSDTQKLVEEKQRRIDSARRLRTTCIFWTHSASEVLLVGSFDGWTSQIKMEKTSTGIFSSSLKLYPGRYEASNLLNKYKTVYVIKFIVDGIWRVDPMLPVVHINGLKGVGGKHNRDKGFLQRDPIPCIAGISEMNPFTGL